MSPIPLRIVHQPGLQWDATLWGSDPEWTEEPSISIIKKLVKRHLDLKEEPDISYFAEGALNKLYAFDCHKGRFIMRVTLPVAPGAKTDSEVATIAFIRKYTTIAVPQIVAHDSNLKNELGFEWIIMERFEAQPLDELWHQMSWLKKQLVVQQLALYWTELLSIRLSKIGSIHTANTDQPDRVFVEPYEVGEIVLPEFFVGDHIQLDIDRGPYNSSRNYLGACLDILLHNATKLLESEDQDDIEHGQTMRDVYDGLQIVVPRYFPHSSHHEQTLVFHRDVSTMNILVNADGDFVSIVDWECVAAVPIWQACELPQLLKGPVYEFAVVREPLSAEAETDADSVKYYKADMEYYELAQLRAFFLEEMQRLSPEWVAAFRTNRLRHDILLAIESCDDDSQCNWIKAWVQALVEGPEPTVSLTDGLRSPEYRRGAGWFQAWIKTKMI